MASSLIELELVDRLALLWRDLCMLERLGFEFDARRSPRGRRKRDDACVRRHRGSWHRHRPSARRAGRARQVADDRLYRPVVMKHDASDVMLAVRSARRPMHRFDDVVSAAEVEKGLLYSAGFKAHCAGRTCARPVWWRTIRVMTTTRRPGDREARDSAARRPRPKVERPADPLLRLNVWPRWPAFFAARITSPTKLFGRLAPWLP